MQAVNLCSRTVVGAWCGQPSGLATVCPRVAFFLTRPPRTGLLQHDEANTHYIGMIDQTTVGHRLLLEEFGAIPRVGWQIDPFGHSATQAALLSAEVGFDSLFFGRIDYQDR